MRRDTPAPLAAVVMRMLEKDVADRFATLHEAVAALRAIPLDEEGARQKLVELGVLSSASISSAWRRRHSAHALVARGHARHAATGDERRADGGRGPEHPRAVGRLRTHRPDPIIVQHRGIIPLRGTAYDASNTPIPGKALAWEISPPDAGEISADGSLTVRNPGDITVTATCDGKRSLARAEVTPLPTNRRSPFVATAIGQAPMAAVPSPSVATGANAAPTPVAPPAVPAAPSAPGEQSSLRRLLSLSAVVSAVVLAGLLFVLVPRLRRDRATGVDAPPAAPSTATPTAPIPPPVAGTVGADAQQQTTNSDSLASVGATPANEATASETPASNVERATVVSVQVTNPPASLGVGERVQLQAVAVGSGGARVGNAPVTWRSSNAAIASVDASRGVVRGVRPGSVQLTASAGGVEQRIPLQVTAPTLTALSIGNLRAVAVGESLTLALSGRTLSRTASFLST